MEVLLTGASSLELGQLHQPGFAITAAEDSLYFGAIPMFVTSLALCTFGVLASYAQRIDADVTELKFAVNWQTAQKPNRVASIAMDIHWPGLPESRLDAAMRAATMCTLHKTLHDAVDIETMVSA